MAMNQFNNTGDFVPTNFIWDLNLVQDISLNSPEFKDLIVRLYQNINLMCLSLNTRDSGRYIQSEYINGQIFFNPVNTSPLRQVFRKVIDFGSLPNATTKSVAHDIDIITSFSFTRIYATGSDPVGLTYIPIPYASSTANENIEISVDATNVNITTAIDYSDYTTVYVILEYLKN